MPQIAGRCQEAPGAVPSDDRLRGWHPESGPVDGRFYKMCRAEAHSAAADGRNGNRHVAVPIWWATKHRCKRNRSRNGGKFQEAECRLAFDYSLIIKFQKNVFEINVLTQF